MKSKKKPWADEERYILKKYYGVLTLEEVLAKLPGRTASSVYSQIAYLRKRNWTFGN